jgi:hypothetical protein
MSKELASGPDWDLRLHKSGRFSLRFDKRVSVTDDGGTALGCFEASGKDLADVFAGLFWGPSDEQLVLFRRVLADAAIFAGEAAQLQRKYSAALSLAHAASRSRRVAAAVALVGDVQGGAL